LEELCRTYWYPLYAYVPGMDISREDAEISPGFLCAVVGKELSEASAAKRGISRVFCCGLESGFSSMMDRATPKNAAGA